MLFSDTILTYSIFIPEKGVRGGGMDDLINQIKQGGVKLKSTKPFCAGTPSKKTETVGKEKPTDAVQEMKSILATMKRSRHGRVKPSAISQEAKSRTTKPKKKADKTKAEETVTANEEASKNETESSEAPPTSENSPAVDTNSVEEPSTSKSDNINSEEHTRETEDTTTGDNTNEDNSNTAEDTPAEKETPKDTETTINTSYTLQLRCSYAGEDESSSREATPPATSNGDHTEEKDNGRPSPARAISSTTIFLRNSRSPSQD